MSNVTVTASGESGLEVDVVLGANVRKTHEVPGGESVELAVGGGQVLSVRAASNVAPAADLPTGADIETEVVENADGEVMFDPNREVSDEEAAAGVEASVEDLGADLFADEGKARNPALADGS